MIFLILLFCSVALLKEVSHLLLKVGLPWLSEWLHAHVLWTAFLLGVMAGQVAVGSNLTGEGWFRSKDGKTFEGFKLEELRRWTWLLVSPLFMLGVVLWCFEQRQSSLGSSFTLANFYHDFLMPNCSDVWGRGYWLNTSCNSQFLFVASWLASIGYSIGPLVRKKGATFLRSVRRGREEESLRNRLRKTE
jgi:hypothetical protein